VAGLNRNDSPLSAGIYIIGKKGRPAHFDIKAFLIQITNQRGLEVDGMYTFVVPGKYLEKLVKIKEESEVPLSTQMKIAIEDYLFRYERSKSPFMRSLGEYKRPEIGEKIRTKHGDAEITDVKYYDRVIEELGNDGFSEEEINNFTNRVEHFLGKKERYFECNIQYKHGETESIDWSEYLAFKNKVG
jgi:hypothetical protein